MNFPHLEGGKKTRPFVTSQKADLSMGARTFWKVGGANKISFISSDLTDRQARDKIEYIYFNYTISLSWFEWGNSGALLKYLLLTHNSWESY